MDKIFKDIKHIADKTHLSATEHDQMDKAVLSAVEATPVAAQKEERPSLRTRIMKHIPKKPSLATVLGRRLAYAAFSVAVILGVGGGTVYASTNALPGDLLYPVKVNVAEEIKAAFQFSDEDKAQFAIERINTRLEEIELLTELVDSIGNDSLNLVEENVTDQASTVIEVTASLEGDKDEDSLQSLLVELQELTEDYNESLSALLEKSSNEQLNATIAEIIGEVSNVEEKAKTSQLSLFVENDEEQDEDITVRPIAFVTHMEGKTFTIGTLKRIGWESIPNARSYKVLLLDSNGNRVGLVWGQRKFDHSTYDLETNMLWTFRPINLLPSMDLVAVEEGHYSFLLQAEDMNGTIYEGNSGMFAIQEPQGATLYLTVTNESGHALSNIEATLWDSLKDERITVRSDGEGKIIVPDLSSGQWEIHFPETDKREKYGLVFRIQNGKDLHMTKSLKTKKSAIKAAPHIRVAMQDVLPDSVSASAYAGKSLLFARGTIEASEDSFLRELEVGCSGNVRHFTGARLVAYDGSHVDMSIIPSHGGFHLHTYDKGNRFDLRAGKESQISLYLTVADPDVAYKKGARYPHKISCGPRTRDFRDANGNPIPQKNISINFATAVKTMKTLLTR